MSSKLVPQIPFRKQRKTILIITDMLTVHTTDHSKLPEIRQKHSSQKMTLFEKDYIQIIFTTRSDNLAITSMHGSILLLLIYSCGNDNLC